MTVFALPRVSRSTVTEQLFGRDVVDVVAVAECFLELRDVGHVRGNAQLDLAVVRAHQHVAGLGDEGVADLAAELGADRDVLQVRVVRRQPPGLRAGQAEAGVDAARFRIDHRLQRVGVGRAKLGQLAPVEHEPRAFDALGREPLELVHVGRIMAALALAAALQAEPSVEHVAQLLRRADGEGAARRFVDALFELRDLFGEFAAELGEIVAIDLHAAALHPADDRDQRLVDALVDPLGMLGRHARLEALPQAKRDVRVLAGIFGGFLERHLVEGDLLRARPAQRLEADAIMVELRLGEIGEVVAEATARIEVEAHQHRVVVGRDVDARPCRTSPSRT